MESLLEAIEKTEEHQYCVEMMKRLDIQRRNEHFCDVILEVGSGDDQARLKAHGNVLTAASPFFYNALKSDMKEKKEGVIRLEETSKAVMEKVLEYLYTGHVDIDEHNAIDLMETADFLIAPSLKDLSSKFVAQTLSSSNCIDVYYTAERYQCPELQKTARDYTLSNFMDVAQSDGFLNLSVTQLEEWIASDDVTVKAEDEIFQVIVKWMERCESRNHQSFFQLFRHVRLVYVSRNYIFNVILPHPLVKDSPACTDFVLDTRKELSYGTEECYFIQPPRSCLKTHEDAIFVCEENQTLCYLLSENKWYKMADVPNRLCKELTIGSGMSACHGKLYVAGVNGAEDCIMERYDPSANSWAPVTPFAGASSCNFPAVVSFQGFLYVVGGVKKNVQSRVHKYNPDTNLWQEVAPLNIARVGVCAVADKNSLYAIGGSSGSTNATLDVVERFDPERNSWSRIASIGEKKMFACGAIVKDKVFLFGGLISPTSPSNHIEMYDPATNMWSNVECTIGRAPNECYSAVSFKGKVFVIGLWGQSVSLQVYDVDKNEWESCSSVPIIGYQRSTIVALRIPRDILDKCQVVPQT